MPQIIATSIAKSVVITLSINLSITITKRAAHGAARLATCIASLSTPAWHSLPVMTRASRLAGPTQRRSPEAVSSSVTLSTARLVRAMISST